MMKGGCSSENQVSSQMLKSRSSRVRRHREADLKYNTVLWSHFLIFFFVFFFCVGGLKQPHSFDIIAFYVCGHTLGERKVSGSNPACDGIFSGSSHTSDLKIGTPVATLPGAWRYRVSTGTGRPSVSILWLDEVERWICNFYLSVAARKIVWADPSLRYTSLLLGR